MFNKCFSKNNHFSYVSLIFILLIFIFSGILYKNHLYSFNFADENENVLGGKLIDNGESIYQDFFVQHQPIPYFISAALHHFIAPQTLRETVKLHRVFVYIWTTIGALFLWILAPHLTALFVVFWELSRFWLFGNLFLAESITIFPLIFLWIILQKSVHMKKLNNFLLTLTAISWCFVFFSLQTAWVWLLIWLVIFAYLKKEFIFKKRSICLFVIPAVIVLILFIKLVPARSWWNITISANLFDYIPSIDNLRTIPVWLQPLKLFASLLFSATTAPFGLFEKSLTWIFVVSTILRIKVNLNYKSLMVFQYIFLLLLAIRPLSAASEYYAGFHKLPFLGLMLFITLDNLMSLKSHHFKLAYSLLLIMAISLITISPAVIETIDSEKTYHEQYSHEERVAEQINSITKEGDTIFIDPDEMLVYYLAKAHHHNQYIYFYGWMQENNKYLSALENSLLKNPPNIIYFKNGWPDWLFKNKNLLWKEMYMSVDRDTHPRLWQLK